MLLRGPGVGMGVGTPPGSPGSDDDVMGVTPEAWTPDEEWRLGCEDVRDVVTSAAARKLDFGSVMDEPLYKGTRVVWLQEQVSVANMCGREPARARAALRRILSIVIQSPTPLVPLSAITKQLRWKTIWWRSLGSLYSFVRRTGKGVLEYKNAEVGLCVALTLDDLQYI